MDLKGKFNKSSLKSKSEQFFNEKVLPTIEDQKEAINKVIKEKIGPVALSTIEDEKTLRFIFSTVYAFMPGAVTIFIGEEKFISFCMEHKDLIIQHLK